MKSKIWNHGFTIIFIINILTATGFSMMLPTLPKYVMYLGFSSTVTGFVATSFVITAVLIRPWTGFLADTGNLKRILAVSLAIIGCAALGYSFSASAVSLSLFRLVHGVGWGLATTITGTYASHALPTDKLGQGIGIFGLASVIASSYAPNLGLQLSESLGYPWMFRIAAMFSVAGILLSIFLPVSNRPERAAEAGNNSAIRPRFRLRPEGLFAKEALQPSLLVLLAVASTSSVSTFLAIYAGLLGIKNIGIFFTVSALTLLFSRPLSGWLSDFLRKELVVYPCIVFICLSLSLISHARSLPLFLAAAVCYGLGFGGLQPMLQAWAVKNTGIARRGVANSTFYMGLDVGTGLGCIISGTVADAAGYSVMYLWMMLPVITAGVIFTWASVLIKRSASKENREHFS